MDNFLEVHRHTRSMVLRYRLSYIGSAIASGGRLRHRSCWVG
ncbi:hypothetical protein [Anabaena sp. CCY 9402-a]